MLKQWAFLALGSRHIDDIVLDPATEQVFFPDACTKVLFQGCDPGIHVFNYKTNKELTEHGIDLGFPPFEIVLAQ